MGNRPLRATSWSLKPQDKQRRLRTCLGGGRRSNGWSMVSQRGSQVSARWPVLSSLNSFPSESGCTWTWSRTGQENRTVQDPALPATHRSSSMVLSWASHPVMKDALPHSRQPERSPSAGSVSTQPPLLAQMPPPAESPPDGSG